MFETRMNTASLCRFEFLCVCLYSFALGNGMEEVIGSIPIRSVLQLVLILPASVHSRVAQSTWFSLRKRKSVHTHRLAAATVL